MRIALVACVLSCPALLSANPLDTFGLGSQGAAMASAMTAVSTDFAANYYNPAGLARGRRLRISVGYLYADADLSLNGRDSDVDPSHGLVFGVAAPGRAAGIPFAFGLGLYLPDDRVSRVRSIPQRQPRWELYDNRTQRLFLSANVSIEPLAGLSIGGGISFMSSTQGLLAVRGFVTYPDPSNSELEHSVDADLRAVRYPQVGIRYAPNDWLELGVVYRGQFQLDLRLQAVLGGEIVAFDALTIRNAEVALESASVNAFLPQQVALGVAVRPRRDLLVAADVTWVDWSAYRSPTAKVDYDLRIEIPEEFQDRVVVPEIPPGVDPLPPRFEDRLVPRIGFEWTRRLSAGLVGKVRCGYAFERSPVPDQPGETNFVDSDRHVLTAGLGIEARVLPTIFPRPFRLDAHVQAMVFDERHIVKTDAADSVGDYTADGTITAFGTNLEATF